MNHQQKLQWIENLKVGDSVGVFEFYGKTYRQTRQVKRKTPTGRIVLDCGSTYNKEGEIIGSYTGRSIGPVPTEEASNNDKEAT
jgi:hypothetical protein